MRLRSNLIAKVAASILAFALAIWVGAIAPVEQWVIARRIANAASGHLPNMEPGVVLLLAVFIVTPFALAAVLIEAIRLFRGGAPMSIFSVFVLGLVVAAPVGFSLAIATSSYGWPAHAVIFLAGICSFYGVRRVALHLWQRLTEKPVRAEA